jgi:hypothetical protein
VPRTRKIQGPDGQKHEAEPIGFRSSGEHFNEYLLNDGSILRIKLVVTEVLKVKDMYDAYGNPAYLAMHSQVMSVDAPDNLRERGEENG